MAVANVSGTGPPDLGPNDVLPFIIDNADTASRARFLVTSPDTSETIYTCSSASSDDAIAAVRSASCAFRDWSSSSTTHRRDILLRAATILESRTAECLQAMCSETGAAPGFCEFNVKTAISILRDTACRIQHVMSGMALDCEEPHRKSMVIKTPMGVILAIAPWNAPLILGIRAVATAISGGNTCVLKGSELSPRCFWILGDVLRQAGLTPGVCNVLYCRREDSPIVTSTLIEAKEVRKISFTGSSAVGSKIAEIAGKALKPCLLELGGKAPAVVLDDADLELAAKACVTGALLHAGQVCMSTERVIVHEDIIEHFKGLLKHAVEEMYPSKDDPPLLAMGAGVQKNVQLVDAAVRKGARVLHGDVNGVDTTAKKLRPVVLDGVTKDMDIYRTESFGPTFSIMSFKTEAEALDLCNDNDYGLNASVFTRDLARGLRISRMIEAGNVHINSMTVHDEPNLPHGGVKDSGWGRFNGDKGIEEFLVSKTITWME